MTSKPDPRRRRATHLSLEWIGVLEWRKSMFERAFGRPPRRGEPLFFDPKSPVPTRLPPEARRRALDEVMALVE